jgi:hypothetical protein
VTGRPDAHAVTDNIGSTARSPNNFLYVIDPASVLVAPPVNVSTKKCEQFPVCHRSGLGPRRAAGEREHDAAKIVDVEDTSIAIPPPVPQLSRLTCRA